MLPGERQYPVLRIVMAEGWRQTQTPPMSNRIAFGGAIAGLLVLDEFLTKQVEGPLGKERYACREDIYVG